MRPIWEAKKLKRTGFVPLFVCGGLLAAAVPILNMMVRGELFTGQGGDPLTVLLEANWQMMAMLNLFLLLIGACLLYHIEYADCGLRKMDVLPIARQGVFFSKCVLLFCGCCGAALLETVSLGLCMKHWFSLPEDWAAALSAHFGVCLLLLAPVLILMTGISSVCGNMWMTLGIGLVGIFVPVAAGQTDSILAFFPFSMPLSFARGMGETALGELALAACLQGAAFSAAAGFYQKKRGSME